MPERPSHSGGGGAPRPSVTLVYVVFNRRDELRLTLQKMLQESDYPTELVDAIVIDNASSDGSAAMVREEFPDVHVIERDVNIGAPAWNEGFAAARGDFVLIIDDDCYLPPDGLRLGLEAAETHGADLISFSVASTKQADWLFTEKYRTGLLTFWGCSALVRRAALDVLGGYDPAIFMWANELELTIRLFDHGYTHLHLPEVVAQHMKAPSKVGDPVDLAGYRRNARHFAYVAAKLLRPRDAAEALVALLTRDLRDGLREHPGLLRAVKDTLSGFALGLRRRQPVQNAELSRTYRRNFENFASPWWLSRSPLEVMRTLPRELVTGKRPEDESLKEGYYEARPQFYPRAMKTLSF